MFVSETAADLREHAAPVDAVFPLETENKVALKTGVTLFTASD